MFETQLKKPIGIFNVFIPSNKGYSYHYNHNPLPSSKPSDHDEEYNNQSNKNNSNTNQTHIILSLPEPHDEDIPVIPDLEAHKQDDCTFIKVNEKQYHRILRRRKIRQILGIKIVKENRKRKNVISTNQTNFYDHNNWIIIQMNHLQKTKKK
eukprot:457199_1